MKHYDEKILFEHHVIKITMPESFSNLTLLNNNKKIQHNKNI